MIGKKTKELIEKLHRDTPKSEQEEAIKELIKIDDDYIYLLVMPKGDANYWENAALVLRQIEYQRILHLVPYLVKWMNDFSQPGAQHILDLLSTIDVEIMIPHIEYALLFFDPQFSKEKMDGLKLLVKNKKIKKEDFIQKDLYDKI